MPIFKNFYNGMIDLYDSIWKDVSKVRGINKRLDIIAEFIVGLAKSYCPQRTGKLYDSIDKKKTSNENGYIISIYGEGRRYGRFVEYGTGVRGENDPHPQPPSSWKYNAYFDENGIDWQGFTPRAFMYNAYTYILNAISSSDINSKWYKVRFTSYQKTPAIIIEKR